MAAKKSSTAPRRISFAKIREPLEVPNLLALQIESVDWLLGNDAWRSRLAETTNTNRGELPSKSGLEEIFEEISPIEDFQGTMSLSFRDHRFEPPKYSIAECKERDMTYAQPLFVTAEFTNNETGEIKSQTVFMGDFPVMTPRGTFVINGTERVVVSQIVRSPVSTLNARLKRLPIKMSSHQRLFQAVVHGLNSKLIRKISLAFALTASVSNLSLYF